GDSRTQADKLEEILELANTACLTYEMGLPAEKRRILDTLTSNRTADQKNVVVELSFPFNIIANRTDVPTGSPYRDIPRTWMAVIKGVLGKVEESRNWSTNC